MDQTGCAVSQSSTSPYREHLPGTTAPAAGRTRQPVADTHRTALQNPHAGYRKREFTSFKRDSSSSPFFISRLIFLYFVQFCFWLFFPLLCLFICIFSSSFSPVSPFLCFFPFFIHIYASFLSLSLFVFPSSPALIFSIFFQYLIHSVSCRCQVNMAPYM